MGPEEQDGEQEAPSQEEDEESRKAYEAWANAPEEPDQHREG